MTPGCVILTIVSKMRETGDEKVQVPDDPPEILRLPPLKLHGF